MKYDIIIIGAGESGLNKALELLAQGKNVAVVSAGKSTIAIRHAAKDLLNYDALQKEGIEKEIEMHRNVRKNGGIILEGDEVTGGLLCNDGDNLKLQYVTTKKLEGEQLTADAYYLATGTFFSRGLRSTYTGIEEPLFGLDVDAPQAPAEWINDDFFAEQPFMKAHVKTDQQGHGMKDGKTVGNLYCIGSIAGLR